MDINELEPISAAGAVAHQAAARFCGLMSDDESALDDVWYNPGGAILTEEMMDRHIEAMAGFVCERQIGNGEALYNFAQQRRFLSDAFAVFANEPVANVLAYNLFVTVCLRTYQMLKAKQDIFEAVKQAAARKPEKLKREDSIFEETDELDELVDHADSFLAIEAKAQAPRARVDKAPGKTMAAANPQMPVPLDFSSYQGHVKKAPTVGPMKAGETMPRQPENKGGRPPGTVTRRRGKKRAAQNNGAGKK